MTRGFTRILVPTDFSAPSDAALAAAKELATRFGATRHQGVVAPRGRQASQCAADASGTLRIQGDDHGALQRIGGERDRRTRPGQQHQSDRDGHARPRRSCAPADRQCGRARRSDRNVSRSDSERDCDSARIRISSGGRRGRRRMITRPSRARTSRCGSGPDRD